MRLSELDYELPSALIAQEPLESRSDARLQVLDRSSGKLEYSRFYKLAGFLREGDLLVVNDTRVIPARLIACKESGGKIELLLIRPLPESEGAWLSLLRSHRQIKEGTRLILDSGHALRLLCYQRPGRAIVASDDSKPLSELLKESGLLALPPYIRREVAAADQDDYQTVYAEHQGAIAAPTAGLHFTPALVQRLAEHGVQLHRVTLHVGAGTFAPVRAEDTRDHRMHSEWGAIEPATAEALNAVRERGGRVVCVGTTSARVVESAADENGRLQPLAGETDIFITPGFRFRCVDALMTNFHLPRSTLFMLVSAFSGLKTMRAAYAHAVQAGYRFYSYGDACLLLRGSSASASGERR